MGEPYAANGRTGASNTVASARTWMCGLVLSGARTAKRNGGGRTESEAGLFGALRLTPPGPLKGVRAVGRPRA